MANTPRDTRIFILETALQLFLQQGYKKVTYLDIMQKTGLSKGAIYHYFKSKEDLLARVFEYLLAASKEVNDKNMTRQLTDRDSFITLYIKLKQEQFDQLKKRMKSKTIQFNKILFFIEAINENKLLKNIVQELAREEIAFLKDCLDVLKKQGEIPAAKDPDRMANSLYLMLQGTETMSFLENSKDLEPDFLKLYKKAIEDFFILIL